MAQNQQLSSFGQYITVDTTGNNVTFNTGGVRIGSSSNLGNSLLDVALGITARNSNVSTTAYFQTYNMAAGTNLKTWRMGGESDGSFRLQSVNDAYTSSTERFRMDSDGNAYFGTSAANPIASRVDGITFAPVGFINVRYTNNMALGLSGSSGTHINFYTDNGSTYVSAGTITSSGSSTAFNTSSDYRLKENIVPFKGGLSAVLKMKPVSFSWKEGYGVGNNHGLIAHEIQQIVPYAVVGEKDAVDDDGRIKPQGVDYSKLVVHLISAIQELNNKIEMLQTEINDLRAN